MTDLGPLAERLRNVENHKALSHLIDSEALAKFGEGLDGRVLEKVVVALEARLNEHSGQVDRRLAEIDAQVALDLKAVDTHTATQTDAVEKALRQMEAQVRDYVTSAREASIAQIAGVDQRLSALQETLPAKFREIIDAVRQSMEARVALELKELEERVAAGRVTPEQIQDLETRARGEIESLAGRLSGEMHRLADEQHSQAAPFQQALQQLEVKLTTLREELPPKIRQIVEAVESSMEARIAAGDRQSGERLSAIEAAVTAIRAEMPAAGGYQQAIDDNLRRHAEQVGALDQKLTVLQEELPPKIKAIVDAVRDSLDARLALELKAIEDQHSARIEQTEARFEQAQQQLRQQVTEASQAPVLAQGIVKLNADLTAVEARLEVGDRQVTQQIGTEMEKLEARHHTDIEQLETRMRAERAAENMPAQIQSAVDQMGRAVEARLSAEIRELEARHPDRSHELEKALQYASLLESRVQELEQKLQRSAEETVDKAVERVWQALESRLQQRAAQAPPPHPPETISGLRQKSTSAEQSVMDLIAGIGQLFEKSAARPVRETPLPVAAEAAVVVPAEPQPVAAQPVQSEPVESASAAAMPEAPTQESPVAMEPSATEPLHDEPAPVTPHVAAASGETPEPNPEMGQDDKPPVILFKPKDAGRKWRIPFVSSFLLLGLAIAWLEFL